MAVIHNTTLQPTKLQLLARWLPEQAWYSGTSGGLTRAGGFRLDDPDGEVGIEFMVVVAGGGEAYLVPLTYRAAPLDGADDALIGTAEHGVLGTRWIYDGEHDPVLRAQLAALLRGEAVAQAQHESNTADPTVLVQAVDGPATVRITRRLRAGDGPPTAGGYVSATWRRPDGSTARGIVATTDRLNGRRRTLALPDDLGRELRARRDRELGEHVREVRLHGAAGHEEPVTDLRIRQPLGHHVGDALLGWVRLAQPYWWCPAVRRQHRATARSGPRPRQPRFFDQAAALVAPIRRIASGVW